jgi:hypothetical protein
MERNTMPDTTEADKHIADAIDRLCDDLRMSRVGTEKFNQILDAITKLRASMNPTIVTTEEILNRR